MKVKLWLCWERTDHVDHVLDPPTHVYLHYVDDWPWAKVVEVEVEV